MKKTELSKTLNELLVLSAIKKGKIHGYQISKEIEIESEGYFRVTPGTLYPILKMFEEKGLLEGEWEESKSNRKRRFYSITEKGEEELIFRAKNWRKFFTNLFSTVGVVR